MLLCIATAFITATGRLHLGLEQATASRYQTFALLFWCSLGLAILAQFTKPRVARSSASFALGRGSSDGGTPVQAARANAFCGFLLVLMLGFATQVRLPLIDAQWRQLRLMRISLSLLTGVHDPAALADAYPDPQAVLRAAQYMEDHHLSIFAGDLYAKLGSPLTPPITSGPPPIAPDYISSTQVFPANDGEGLRITGYAWDKLSNRPARDIVAVSQRSHQRLRHQRLDPPGLIRRHARIPIPPASAGSPTSRHAASLARFSSTPRSAENSADACLVARKPCRNYYAATPTRLCADRRQLRPLFPIP